MSRYKLSINFTEEALKLIHDNHQRLALAKADEGKVGKEVVWVTPPLSEHNIFQWRENPMLDFSTEKIQNVKLSECVDANEYAVYNGKNHYEIPTFGLAKEVTVNNQVREEGNLINDITLPYTHMEVMASDKKVKIFLTDSVDDGKVISKQFSNALEVEFHDNETEKTITYDCEKGIFISVDNA